MKCIGLFVISYLLKKRHPLSRIIIRRGKVSGHSPRSTWSAKPWHLRVNTAQSVRVGTNRAYHSHQRQLWSTVVVHSSEKPIHDFLADSIFLTPPHAHLNCSKWKGETGRDRGWALLRPGKKRRWKYNEYNGDTYLVKVAQHSLKRKIVFMHFPGISPS